MEAIVTQTHPSEEGKMHFIDSLNAVMRFWPLLRLIVDHGWGEVENPEEHVREMAEDLLDNFLERWDMDIKNKKRKVYADEIEEFFELEFEDRFQIAAEDGSIKDVSCYLVQLFNECSLGKFELVKIVIDRAAKCPPVKYTVSAGGRDALEDEEDEGEENDENIECCNGKDCCKGDHQHKEEVIVEEKKAEIEEEDGWTTVKSSKGKKNRK